MNLHKNAVELVREYQRVESALVEVLREIDARRTYLEHSATSLFVYATKVLGHSESVAWNFITVARATVKSTALKEAIEKGSLSASKARRITSVITQNAATLTEAILEAVRFYKRHKDPVETTA